MERRSFIRQTGLAGVLAAGMAPAVVHAQQALRWRLASSFPKSLDTIYGGGEVFAKKVGEMTGGKFQISVHAAGEIMPAFGVVDGVQNGTVEMAHTVPYYFFGTCVGILAREGGGAVMRRRAGRRGMRRLRGRRR